MQFGDPSTPKLGLLTDVEMADGGTAVAGSFLKPVGGVGKKSKKKLKLNKRHGKKIRKKSI